MSKFLAQENLLRAGKALWEAQELLSVGRFSTAFIALEDAFSAVVEAQDVVHAEISDKAKEIENER